LVEIEVISLHKGSVTRSIFSPHADENRDGIEVN